MGRRELRRLLAQQYRFTAVVEEGGGWSIYYPDLPGCMTTAESWEEVGPMAREVFEIWMTSEYERGHPIPEPVIYEGGEFWPQGLAVAPTGPDGTLELTGEQVAERLGVTRGRVHQLARQHGVGRKVGNAKMFSEGDVAALASRKSHPGPSRKDEIVVAD